MYAVVVISLKLIWFLIITTIIIAVDTVDILKECYRVWWGVIVEVCLKSPINSLSNKRTFQ